MSDDASFAGVESQQDSSTGKHEERRGLLAAWMQFPRRVVLLLIAYGLIRLLLRGAELAVFERTGITALCLRPEESQLPEALLISWSNYPRLVSEVIAERLPRTLFLIGGAAVMSVPLTLLMIWVAGLANSLERRSNKAGVLVGRLGRLLLFPWAAAPLGLLSGAMVWFFAFTLGLFPISKFIDPDLWVSAEISSTLLLNRMLLSAAVALVLVIGLLIVQQINLPTRRRRIAGVGVIVVLVGVVAYWLLLGGRLALDVLHHVALPSVTLALLPATLTAQVLARDLALGAKPDNIRAWPGGVIKWLRILFRQTGGLLGAAVVVESMYSYPGAGFSLLQGWEASDTPLVFGVLVALSTLVLMGRLLGELFGWIERLVHALPLPPALELGARPWGTHRGWIVFSLVLLIIFLLVPHIASLLIVPLFFARMFVAALVVLVVGGSVGAGLGFLAKRRVWHAETVADLLFLPADVVLMVPIIPALVTMFALAGYIGTTIVPGLLTGLVLAPRAIRFYQTLWMAAPDDRQWRMRLLLPGLGALFIGGLFAVFWYHNAWLVWFIPGAMPDITLGGVLGLSFALYTVTDALVECFPTKEAMLHLYE